MVKSGMNMIKIHCIHVKILFFKMAVVADSGALFH